MRKLTVVAAALALAFAALAEEPVPAADATPETASQARKNLADFFLRTRGITRVISASEVWERIRSGIRYRVVDVRPPEDFEKGHIPGAVNIPLDVLFRPASLEKLPVAGDPILLVCQSGHVESMALGGLAALGYEPYVLRFGMIGWNAETRIKVAGSVGQGADVVHGLGGPIER